MDRDTELKINYDDMANLVTRFQKERTRLEGNWYLVEKAHKNGEEVWHQEQQILILGDLAREIFRRNGYTVTALVIFKKNE